MNYGLPYLGSKSGIAKDVLNSLPPAENFYDLFGGGFSITHCAAEVFGNKWKSFHYNEIKKGMCEFIQDAIAGKYNYKNFKPPFITREEFFKRDDQYCKVIWSFGNSCKQYLFNPETEKIKHSLHNAVVFNEFDGIAKDFTGIDKFYTDDIKKRRLSILKKITGNNSRLEHIERFESLQQLERLQQLEQLERKTSFSSLSYDEVKIKENSVIYCDPPYIGTHKYDKNGFDHDKFYDWVLRNKHPVFFSEYQAPKDFKLIRVFAKRSTLSPTAHHLIYEKIFCNNIGYKLIKK